MIRDRNIRQLQRILFMRRIVAYLRVLKYLNRIKEITDAINGKTKFTYDANGNLLTVNDAKGQTIAYTYNSRDKVSSMIDQLGKSETYSYDKMDNLITLTDRKNQKTSYVYDMLNRITKAKYADSSFIDYVYDVVGRITYINDSLSGAISYSYSNTGCAACGSSAVDKVIQEITSLGSISYTYDAIDRRTNMTIAGQPTVNYSYDANSRLTDINTLINNVAAGFSLRYDALGRRTSLTLPNGVTTNYNYDNGSNLLEMKHLNPLNQILEKINYSYDQNGNRTRMNRLNVPVKLPTPVSATSYNSSNQQLTFNDKNITYDNNGNMLTTTNSCGTTTYTWDARNRLTAISGYNTDCSPLTASFKYDALGRRIEKTINGKTIQYLYDGLDIVQEIENGTVTVNYIRTLNIDEPLARIRADGTIRYYQTDALGSVIALTDENGVIKTQYKYSSFGEVDIVGELSDNSLQFVGKENDGTGLMHEGYRYYNFELQRYISLDPIGFAGGDVNFYVRVANNPVNYVDPLGLLVYFPWHEGITYVAARNSGYGVMDSLSLAFNTAAVDFNGSQGQSPSDTVQHAMSGEISPNVWQSPSQAIASTNAFIQQSINSGNLPGAIHAAQDLATPAHSGQEWHGFKLNWGTAKHILGDVFPSWNTIKQAYQNTKGILNPKGCSK